jgi:hypothetical protein
MDGRDIKKDLGLVGIYAENASSSSELSFCIELKRLRTTINRSAHA